MRSAWTTKKDASESVLVIFLEEVAICAGMVYCLTKSDAFDDFLYC